MLSFMLRKGGLYEGGEVLSRGVTSGSRGAGAVIEGSYQRIEGSWRRY
jgi:hypothetical protein